MSLLSFRTGPSARHYAIGPLRFIDYRQATQHPLPCLFFLLPLLVAYEVGIWSMPASELARNGADSWLRGALESFGLPQLYWAPALVACFFLAWSWLRRDDLPDDVFGVCVGMAIESLAFGLALWVLFQSMGPLAELVRLTVSPDPGGAFHRVVTYVGAGIYEEVLFRLLLYSGLVFLFRLLQMWSLLAMVLAAGVSALLFSAAHHAGPYGEPFDDQVFFFRALAGVYFAALYQLRGFGIAVGAHVFYDVLAGVKA